MENSGKPRAGGSFILRATGLVITEYASGIGGFFLGSLRGIEHIRFMAAFLKSQRQGLHQWMSTLSLFKMSICVSCGNVVLMPDVAGVSCIITHTFDQT